MRKSQDIKHEMKKRDLEENCIMAHTLTEQWKLNYAEMHLKVLEYQRLERHALKEIIKAQVNELACNEEYAKFVKGGE